MSPEQRILDAYGFAFPDDFFQVQAFLAELPPGALEEACDMRPAYPFRLAAGEAPREHPERPLWESRYYHDLPEFVTLFHGSTDGLHWGYFFDAPGELQPGVASWWSSDTFDHDWAGDSVFEAIRTALETTVQDLQEDDEDEEAEDRLADLAVIRKTLGRYWGKDRKEIGEDYLDEYDDSAWRSPIADTWSRLGIVAPPESYRPLSVDFSAYETEQSEELAAKLLLEARELLTQGYPAGSLKLGHDLWAWVKDPSPVYELLDGAYAALGREPLRRLMAEAAAHRRHCDRK